MLLLVKARWEIPYCVNHWQLSRAGGGQYGVAWLVQASVVECRIFTYFVTLGALWIFEIFYRLLGVPPIGVRVFR
jgi:hypothetical protein